jgi:Flp pilus assembly protein TadG
MIRNRFGRAKNNEHRRGAIMILAAAMLVVVFGFAAFTVDFGMVTLTKAQLQSAVDSSSHAAVLEVARSFSPGPEISVSAADTAARDRAVEMIGRFRTGDQVSTDADQTRDVRLGRRSWNQTSGTWDEEWGVSPYNMVEVTVRRTNADTTALPMTLAQILGREDFDLQATSASALFPGTGFRLDPDSESKIGVLPIALDLGSWNDLVDQAYNNVDRGY